MHFRFTVDVELERDEGKFASRDDLSEQLVEALEGADPGTLEGENGGQYSVMELTVEEVAAK